VVAIIIQNGASHDGHRADDDQRSKRDRTALFEETIQRLL